MLIHNLFQKQFEIVDDVSILEKYANRQYAVKGTNYSEWKRLTNAEKVRDWPKSSLAYSAQSYIARHDPSLASLVDCNTSVFSPDVFAITTFNIVDIWDLYYGRKVMGLCSTKTG
ncbi:MAG: hypothetical protein ACPH14_04355 [Candidatus Puniceispirillaceae bacterium]